MAQLHHCGCWAPPRCAGRLQHLPLARGVRQPWAHPVCGSKGGTEHGSMCNGTQHTHSTAVPHAPVQSSARREQQCEGWCKGGCKWQQCGCILDELHSLLFGGHLGVERTLSRITLNSWWPGVKQDVKEFICTCPASNARNHDQRHEAPPLAPEPRISRPFERIGIDFMEEPQSARGNHTVLVVIDHATK